ncbi:MAG: PKD domain-containing protein [Bacteroidetes bacterium]|nr:PKD domain-containing protein [Bacteroidota bacterium]
MKNLKFAILFLFCQFFMFSTEAQLPTVNVTTNINPSNGYTFLANFWTGTAGKYYLLILDKQGRTIYAKSFPFGINGGFLDFKPQPNNKYSFFSGKQSRYYIMDSMFNIINTVVAKNGYTTNNHELVISNDNRYYIIADETRTIDMSLIVSGGDSNAQVIGSIIQGIDANDSLIFEWKALDHISITDHVGDLTAPIIDFTHTNGLFLDTDTSILMCNPELNEITKISLNSGNIIWRLGLLAHSNQFTFINDTLGFRFQHFAHRLANGNITLFDNGISHYSRAIEYEIDEVNKTAKLVFEYRNTPDIYAWAMGSAIRIANGNTFICWGSVPRMTEVDTGGNKVFEATFSSGTYRALKYDIPNPIAQLISGPSEICKGQTATYSAYTDTNCTYSWSVVNGTIISGQGTNVLTVKWPNNGQATVRLTKTNSLNYKDYFRIYVTVLPNPTVNMGVVEICEGARFIDYTSNSVSCFWDFGDGDTSILSDINHIYSSPGTYQVKLKVINNYGCTDSSIQTVVIPDAPIADFNIDSIVCASDIISIINNSTDEDGYFWYLGDSMISNSKNLYAFSFPAAGSYDIKLIVTGSGCIDSISKTVIVNPNPKAHFSFSEICNGARFIDSTINSTYRLLDFGDGDTSVLSDINHIYSSPGTYQVKLKVINNYGCTDSSIQTLVIPNAPIADFNIDSIVCVNKKITIINNSTFADSYFWDLGDGNTSILTDVDHMYSSPGTYQVKLKVFNNQGCADSSIQTVIIHYAPEADFSIDSIVCVNEKITILNNSSFADSYFWDLGNSMTSNLENPLSFLYVAAGTYDVKLFASGSGCSDTLVKTVIVNANPQARISDSEICNGARFIDSTINSVYRIWDFGDGDTSILSDINHTYSSSGTYQVKLKAINSDGCTDSSMLTVIIPEAPKADFSIDMNLCSSEISTIINNSTDADAYFWYLEDSMISNLKNPLALSFPAVGSYDIKLIVTGSGCIDSLTKTVIVNANPQARFSFSEICNGARFIDSTINSVYRIWDFGDGDTSILSDINHTYSSSGTYQVKLKAINSDGCTDSSMLTVIIPEAPKADFSIDFIVCASETISIINNSTDASNYFWDLGDSRTSNLMTPEAFSYNTVGSYQIKLVASTSVCSDSLIQTVFVMPNPAVKFGSITIADSTIQFHDSSTISAGSIVSWDWNFGDGKTSTIQHPVHIFSSPGTYTVKLCVSSNDGCEDCDIKSITVMATGIDLSVIDNLINIFPNPSKGYFTIKSSKKLDLIVITNAFGQEVMVVKPKTDTALIDLTNKPKGVYIVKLTLENQDQMIRIIKN